ncbi:MAG: M13 family metallopeptidase [Bacteroidota bacterium]|nr:M13 family metallopeptidase [Bacteroidota bacterium]
MKSRIIKSLIIPLSILTLINQCNSPNKQPSQTLNDGFDTSSLDLSFRPQDDFDSFANGGWKKRNPIPSTEGSWGAFGILDKENTEVKLKGIIDEVSKNKSNKANSDEQKIADMYRSFMDTTTIENLALSPLQYYIDQIENIKNLDEWIAVSGELQKIGVANVVGIYVDADDKNSKMNAVKFVQGGLSLGEKSFYTGNDERMQNIRNEFVNHVDKFIALTGDITENTGKTILGFETKLANIQLSNVELRDPDATYNKVSMSDLKKISGKIDWSVFAKKQDVISDTIIVQNLPYYTKLNTLLSSTPIETLKIYAFYKLVLNFSTYLPKQFKDERFNFYGVIKSGIKEQKKRDIQAISVTESLGEGNILGRLYTKQYFPESSKQKVSEMIENVRAVYGERIAQLNWMSDSTKLMAKKKLSTFTYKIGYPDQWDDYSDITVKPDALIENVISNSLWSHSKMVKDIGKPVDKKRWYMSPQTVNAYYNPLNNEIVFPAGILQAPFFNPNADDAINYGGIIAVIGHEFTHGFDDQGAKYDETGNLRNWWNKQDFDNFNQLSKRYIDYFSSFQPLPNVNINGELTIGENIADLGGLTLAYYALVRSLKGKTEPAPIDGFTWQQRFFLSWAQVWHNNIKDEELRNRIQTDPHSPARYRINGPLKHLTEFYDAFGVKQGDKMWLSEGERIKIWYAKRKLEVSS